jgi:hypothetical protein
MESFFLNENLTQFLLSWRKTANFTNTIGEGHRRLIGRLLTNEFLHGYEVSYLDDKM